VDSILALLLGRLQMTVSDAIEAYISLESVMATQQTEIKEERSINTHNFAKAFKKIMDDRGLSEDALMELSVDSDALCKVSVRANFQIRQIDVRLQCNLRLIPR
jgi:hypothetical protein